MLVTKRQTDMLETLMYEISQRRADRTHHIRRGSHNFVTWRSGSPLVNGHLEPAVDYWTKCLAENLLSYDWKLGRSAVKRGKRLQVQKKSQTFHSLEPIWILSFSSLQDVRHGWGKQWYHATGSFFFFFIERPATTAVKRGISMQSEERRLRMETIVVFRVILLMIRFIHTSLIMWSPRWKRKWSTWRHCWMNRPENTTKLYETRH